MNSTAVFEHTNSVSILGCGWFGLALAKALVNDGIHVKGSTTSPGKIDTLTVDSIEPYLVNFATDNESYDARFFNSDILLIAIPPKARSGGGADFIYKIEKIIGAIKQHGVKKVIFISSTGVYADLNQEVDEGTNPQPNTEAGRILFAAEGLFRQETAFKTAIIRFAGLIGPGRNPGRFFAGKKNVPNGKAPVNLIHLDDCIGICKAILTQDAFGYLFNGCSPQHPLKSVFYSKAAADAGLEKPGFIDELKEWKIVRSVNVDAMLGYRFKQHLSSCDIFA